jgi:hypothetical protein
MKKFSLLIALTLLAGSVTPCPSIANAQDDAMAEFERVWYDTCYTKKDKEKCYQQSKELVDKYPKSTYLDNAKRNIKGYERDKTLEKFETALTAYTSSNPPDGAKLDQLFAAGDEGMKGGKVELAVQQFFLGRMALVGAAASMGEIYKNLDRVKGYAETALRTFESSAPPEGWKKEEWEPLRELVMTQMNQYLGWYFTEGTKSDPNRGLEFLSKAVQIRGKDGAGWKDANNYYLRSLVYSSQYTELRKQYDSLPTDADKTGDPGKEILKKINDLLDTKLIPEYARILATATKPENKGVYDFAKSQFDSLWEYRTGAKEKAAEYIKNYVADPSIPPATVPAKAEDTSNLNAPAAPVVGPSNLKLSTSPTSTAPGGKGAANGNGGKAAPAKGKAKSTPKSKKRGRG